MKNLPQFRNKPHEEVRQYILETKGIDIGSNFNWNNTIVWILIGLVVVAGGIGIVKWCQQRQMKKQDGDILGVTSKNCKEVFYKMKDNIR